MQRLRAGPERSFSVAHPTAFAEGVGAFVLPSNASGFFRGLGATGELLTGSTPIPSLGAWGVLLLIFALGVLTVRQRHRFNV